jgi:hypothetical protein
MFGSFNRLIIAATSLAIVAAVSPAAQAATDTIYKYTTPKTGYFAISPLAMAADSEGADFFANFSGGSIKLNANSNTCFMTGVNLPNGATITGVAVFYSSGGSFSPNFQMLQHKLSDGTLTTIANESLTDNTGSRKSKALTLQTPDVKVNNLANVYSFATCLGQPSNTFFGARIVYTYDNAGD